ncbi:ABC transporter ATP-binding protein [Haloarcula mannanilytica]|uniref:ABC transporter ATP-binding protein n=1 Tax=Haloarcula mannanilytica TaxID=2509225 RepID=UPI0010F9EF46|nr:ABC transporter ATP-binding protein [Haloarcula mannanilytica]
MDRTGTPAVELDGVIRRYGETTAVENLSLSVREGEFFTLVGPSGCGKTTTLRLIAGFEDPTRGEVRFGGESVTGVPPEDRDVGVVFQNYALFPHMTVGENVAYGLSFTDPPGGGSDAERVRELLELVDLGDMADRDPDTLSGGQQQRVAMARALAPGPDVLLLDEPMSALDAKLRERLRVQVREIQQELGITTIYVTHDQEEALAVSDRVAVMHDGTPEQVAPPRTIYREPATEFVATFVGDNNVLSGEVTAVQSDGGNDQRLADVAVGGGTLSVALDGDYSANAVSIGDRLTFCIRPERLAVDTGQNAMPATVTSAEFLGETTRVHLDWDGRELLLRTEELPEGTVTVGFDPADAHIVTAGR